MNVQQAYNNWAEQYDTNENKTRDLEAVCLRTTLSKFNFTNCLEIGCGTGKNTQWLITKANLVTCVDFSEEMLSKAKQKISSPTVSFVQADITKPWSFAINQYNLITFSLVLEHIENLENIFYSASTLLQKDGYIYIGELHPFKQYSGSKARFENEQGIQVVQCHTHNISDFINAAKKYNLVVEEINEYFDEDNRNTIPRVLMLLFKKI